MQIGKRVKIIKGNGRFNNIEGEIVEINDKQEDTRYLIEAEGLTGYLDRPNCRYVLADMIEVLE